MENRCVTASLKPVRGAWKVFSAVHGIAPQNRCTVLLLLEPVPAFFELSTWEAGTRYQTIRIPRTDSENR